MRLLLSFAAALALGTAAFGEEEEFIVLVDGQNAGNALLVEGLLPSGETEEGGLGTSHQQKKHLATISHEPVSLEFINPGFVLWEWIREGYVAPQVELIAANFDHRAPAVRAFEEAYISEVKFPALDASSKDPCYFTVKIDPERIRYEKGEGAEIKGDENVGSKKWMSSNFRFELGDLPCDRVSKIDAFSWEQKVVRDEVGQFRQPTQEPGSLKIDNIELTISQADFGPWAEWYKSFVIDGKDTEADELNGSLEFLSPDMEEVLGTIDFGHVGIISLEQEAVEANAESVARFKVELYCERLSLGDLSK